VSAADITRAKIIGVGGYLPERVVSNAELAETVDTSDEWILGRTGIRQRHLAAPHESAAFMAARAAEMALRHAGLAAEAVGAIILATATPDQAFPATAVRVQAMLGITTGFAFDVSAACSGFIYALSIADAFIRAGSARTVLVIGSEVYSRILDWSDRTTCVLFGDGAGAVLLQAGAEAGTGLLSTHLHANGAYGDMLYVDGAVGQKDRPGTLVMKGQEVFRRQQAGRRGR
jgi:3-oxoacyl-[acyl-carrier-protein] synthase-3